MNFPQKRTFERWLRQLEPDIAIAQGWAAYTCPLCVFLKHIRFAERPAICPKGNTPSPGIWRDADADLPSQPLPKWANAFAEGIDRLALLRPIDGGAPFYRAVTRCDCLAVLADIPTRHRGASDD
jgi:hypothetical protein